MAPYDFNGRVALVTGGGSGIGRAVCQLLARDGARVLVTDLNLKGAQETLKTMPGSGHHLALQMDVTQRDAVEAAIAAARKEFGSVPSLLVNSAGVAFRNLLEDVKEDELSVTLDVNLKGTFILTQAVTKALLERKQESEEETGAVVNIASMSAIRALKGGSPYAASKGGVIALTKSCAAELAGKGVRANCVLPRWVDTPFLNPLSKEEKQILLSTIPLGRMARTEGGGSGIGRAVCQLLARDGARVLVTDLNLKGAQETLKTMPGSGHHLALQVDVTRRDAMEAVIAAAREKFGAPPSLLVNSAGVAELMPFNELKEEQLSTVIDVNLKGTFLVTQAVTKALLEGKQESEEETGAVVNIASLAGKCGVPGMSPYAASKGGVIALTKSCAAELAGKGVRVNCVLPGWTDTPMGELIKKFDEQMMLSSIPLRRMGRPEEVAEAVVFLLSRRSSYMVGACVEVSGGVYM